MFRRSRHFQWPGDYKQEIKKMGLDVITHVGPESLEDGNTEAAITQQWHSTVITGHYSPIGFRYMYGEPWGSELFNVFLMSQKRVGCRSVDQGR